MLNDIREIDIAVLGKVIGFSRLTNINDLSEVDIDSSNLSKDRLLIFKRFISCQILPA